MLSILTSQQRMVWGNPRTREPWTKGGGLLFLLTPPGQQSKLARAAHHAEDDQHGANPVCWVVITVLKPSDGGNQGLCSWGHSVPQPHTADVHLPATACLCCLLKGLLWRAQGWSCLNVIPQNNAEFKDASNLSMPYLLEWGHIREQIHLQPCSANSAPLPRDQGTTPGTPSVAQDQRRPQHHCWEALPEVPTACNSHPCTRE